jgi:uncharacterized membrane protein YesL
MNPFSVLKRATASWYEEAYLYVLLSIVWVLSQATVVLGPPVTAALFHVAHEQVHDRMPSWQKFKDGFVMYWRRGWIMGIVYDLVLMVTLVDLWFYLRHFHGMWKYLFFLWVYVLIVWMGASLYLWPMVVGMEEFSLATILRNALLITLGFPMYTFVLVLAIVVVGAIGVVLPVIGALAFPAWAALVSEWAFTDRMAVARARRSGEK